MSSTKNLLAPGNEVEALDSMNGYAIMPAGGLNEKQNL